MQFFKKSINFISILILVIACISCSYKPQQVFFEKNSAENTSLGITPIKNYVIHPQDLLHIRNLQNKKYIVDEPVTAATAKSNESNADGQTYRVEDDGTVALPMIGRIQVTGLTRHEAALKIEALYSKELKDPIIELKIVSLKVTLLGEINKQGIYNLQKDRTSLIEIIGEGGGVNDRANIKKVKIIRGGMDNPQILEFDLSDLKTLSDSRTILQNNDVVFIVQNRRAVNSDKLKSMSAVLQPVISLLNTALIIYTITR